MYEVPLILLSALQWLKQFNISSSPNPNVYGFDLLHRMVSDSLVDIYGCLQNFGREKCLLLQPEQNNFSNVEIAKMLIQGCYPVFVKETLKFIAKVSENGESEWKLSQVKRFDRLILLFPTFCMTY